MTSHRDPPRLRDLAGETDDRLAKALEEMALDEPSAEQLEGVAARARLVLGLPPGGGPAVPPQVSPPATPPLATAATVKGTFTVAQWVSRVIVPMSVGVLGAVVVKTTLAPAPMRELPSVSSPAARVRSNEDDLERRAPTPAVPALLAPQGAGDGIVASPVASSPPSPSSVRSARNGVRTDDKPPESIAPSAPAGDPSSNPTELSLLERAHQALATDPLRALDLAREHELRFAFGALAQEREVIAIHALIRLARQSEAEARAARFHAAYPASAHGRRIDVLLSTNR